MWALGTPPGEGNQIFTSPSVWEVKPVCDKLCEDEQDKNRPWITQKGQTYTREERRQLVVLHTADVMR